MSKQNNNSKNNKGRKGRSNARRQPPQLRSNVMFNHTYRFRSTVGTNVSITDTNLVESVGALCAVANTTLYNIAGSVKVNRINIWTPTAAQGASATCDLEFNGLNNSPNMQYSDSTISVSEGAHLSVKPPKESLAAFWQKITGTQVFSITAPTGSIIDVRMSIILADGVPGTAYTVAAGVAGVMYYPPLDGVSDQFLPVSLTTTT